MADHSLGGVFNGQTIQITVGTAEHDLLTLWSVAHGSIEKIQADCIIGCIPAKAPNATDILFVDVGKSGDAEAPRESLTVFHSVTVFFAPPELLDICGHQGSFFTDFVWKTNPYALHVVVSVASGQRRAEHCLELLVKPFFEHFSLQAGSAQDAAKAGFYAVHLTDSADSVTTLAKETILPAALAGQRQGIILLSGDGGVVELLAGLLGDVSTPSSLPSSFVRPTIALLPVGTGNALANSSLAANGNTLGMATLFRGSPAPLPLFNVRFDPPATPIVPPDDASGAALMKRLPPVQRTTGAVVFSWALHAALVADSDTTEYRKHGAKRFQLAAQANLMPPGGGPPHAYAGHVDIQREGEGEDGWSSVPGGDAHSYVLATLCTRLEKTFTVSPASKPLERVLRFLHISAYMNASGVSGDGRQRTTGERIGQLMAGGYAGGTHVQEPDVQYEAIRSLRLRMDEDNDADSSGSVGGIARWRRVCIDGRIFETRDGSTVTVEGPTFDEAGDLHTALDIVHFQSS